MVLALTAYVLKFAHADLRFAMSNNKLHLEAPLAQNLMNTLFVQIKFEARPFRFNYSR